LKSDAHIGITEGGERSIDGQRTARTFAHEVLLHGTGASDDGTAGSFMESGGSGTTLKPRALNEIINGPFAPAGRQPTSSMKDDFARQKMSAGWQKTTGMVGPGEENAAENEVSVDDIIEPQKNDTEQ